MNLAEFIASLSPEQNDALKAFVFDNYSEANVFMNRARTSHAEAYWHGRFDSFQLLYCYFEVNCLKNSDVAKGLIETSTETPERWLGDGNDDEDDEDDEDKDEIYNVIHGASDDDDDSEMVTVTVSYALMGGTEYRCFVKDKNKTKSESYVVFLSDDDSSIGGGSWLDSSCIRETEETTEVPYGYTTSCR
jgi:hypothetical protein